MGGYVHSQCFWFGTPDRRANSRFDYLVNDRTVFRNVTLTDDRDGGVLRLWTPHVLRGVVSSAGTHLGVGMRYWLSTGAKVRLLSAGRESSDPAAGMFDIAGAARANALGHVPIPAPGGEQGPKSKHG